MAAGDRAEAVRATRQAQGLEACLHPPQPLPARLLLLQARPATASAAVARAPPPPLTQTAVAPRHAAPCRPVDDASAGLTRGGVAIAGTAATRVPSTSSHMTTSYRAPRTGRRRGRTSSPRASERARRPLAPRRGSPAAGAPPAPSRTDTRGRLC
eukprot:6850349-Prymnesium_polylepis.2